MSIQPTDMLPIGTQVGVGNKLGEVVDAEWKKDQFGNPISVHTIKFNKIFSHTRVQNNKKVSVYKPYNKTQTVNYSAITVIDIP